ncbi:right-handed parallel beta-helix repeat-containing protein [Alicyclobacillus ferrooxydans]|uniref:Right handed beta helix domain-containing protein n=1 Tax=Alicyclobacillus ferrooxydans TaxID=471514 RepID=A0A0N8PNT8_9BACL|nr:right-handed parallel beta-helix repeat-containing protein [Alicyclobacillus ferrooxydans]KPV42445.1 hypothetical protein AN477_17810 [Alicyclobacillus ferrooxydans]
MAFLMRKRGVVTLVVAGVVVGLGVGYPVWNGVALANHPLSQAPVQNPPVAPAVLQGQQMNSAALPTDSVSFLKRFKLPPLQRMTNAQVAKLITPLQVMQRIQKLGINTNDFFYPDKQWKNIYNSEYQTAAYVPSNGTVSFSGTTASGLNQFIKNHPKTRIVVTASKLKVDETINVTSGVTLYAKGTELVEGQGVSTAIEVRNCDNAGVEGFRIDTPFDYGIYVINGNGITLKNNTITAIAQRPVVVIGTTKNLYIGSNVITNNQHGGLYIQGNVSHGVIENNVISDNFGASNWMAGIVLTDVPVTNTSNPFAGFASNHYWPSPVPITQKLASPHDIVVDRNYVIGNNANGIYSDGSYMNYFLENHIEANDKEGMCLDNGSFGNYVADNIVSLNGNRARQTEEDLKLDGVAQFGREKNGSSNAKLPGISIDNAAYNIIFQNTIKNNYGDGVKIVRTGILNLIGENTISDNNRGVNSQFHFFGILLGSAPGQGTDLNFTPSYENIVFSNLIEGGHYSGILIDTGDFRNDVFDNVILGAEHFSIENNSSLPNELINNDTNIPSRAITWKNTQPPAAK